MALEISLFRNKIGITQIAKISDISIENEKHPSWESALTDNRESQFLRRHHKYQSQSYNT